MLRGRAGSGNPATPSAAVSGSKLSPEKHSGVSKERSMQLLTAFFPSVTQIGNES